MSLDDPTSDETRAQGETGAPARALGPGAVAGRFELLRELGRGAQGVVYEARDRELGRAVAFKALRPEPGGAGGDAQLLREAEIAARLAHPNVVALYDVGRTAEGPYLVLELLRGRTLAARLAEGPLSPAEAVRVAVEVAKGLAHAHAHGVIHRALTPASVFLCADGQVKLLDLGLAHAAGRQRPEGGARSYTAPEQARGAPEDERTDVFALGLLLHAMLAGAPPRAGAAAPRLDVVGAPALGDVVARMLATDPVDRPRDGQAALDALAPAQQALDAAPIAGRSAAVRVRRRRARRAWILAAAALAAAVGAGGAALLARRSRPAGDAARSVAVLPFDDLSPAHDQQFFSDGLSEELIDALAHVEGLRVIGRTSSFALRGQAADLAGVAAKLGVGAVLEGSVRAVGRRVRITAHLVKVPEAYNLWSEEFDRELDDVLAVQDDIAAAVAAALRVQLVDGGRAARGAGRERRPASDEAYLSYLLARHHHAKFSQEGFRAAVDAYRRALQLDPRYAPAWAGLAMPLHYVARWAEPDERRRLEDQALDAAERALALDPALPEALCARGYLRGVLRWDWRGARADLDRAIALAPGDAATVRRYAIVRQIADGPAAAEATMRRAAELDPLLPATWLGLGELLLEMHRLPDARAALERAGEVSPGFEGLGYARALLALGEGRPAEALAAAQEEGSDPDRLMATMMALRALGRDREARQALADLAARHAAGSPAFVAAAHAWMGDLERAFELYARAVELRDPALVNLRAEGAWMPALRRDPRYAALVRRVGLAP